MGRKNHSQGEVKAGTRHESASQIDDRNDVVNANVRAFSFAGTKRAHEGQTGRSTARTRRATPRKSLAPGWRKGRERSAQIAGRDDPLSGTVLLHSK